MLHGSVPLVFCIPAGLLILLWCPVHMTARTRLWIIFKYAVRQTRHTHTLSARLHILGYRGECSPHNASTDSKRLSQIHRQVQHGVLAGSQPTRWRSIWQKVYMYFKTRNIYHACHHMLNSDWNTFIAVAGVEENVWKTNTLWREHTPKYHGQWITCATPTPSHNHYRFEFNFPFHRT